jgi:hypothetical protein
MLASLGVFLQNSKGVTMSTIEVGEHLYTIKLNLTGMTEYGVSFSDLTSGSISPPAEGARFDAAFEGQATGAKLNGTVSGVDYMRVRGDGRMELHIHETITTTDGKNIDAQGDGVGIPRPEGGILDIRVNMTLFTSLEDYKWVNPLQVWGIGVVNLAEGTIEVSCHAA